LFALANTNIRFEPGMPEGLANSLSIGIVLGLFIGKTTGHYFAFLVIGEAWNKFFTHWNKNQALIWSRPVRRYWLYHVHLYCSVIFSRSGAAG